MDETLALIKSYFGCKKYEEAMMGSYGLSKALLNVYTRAHALAAPGLVINACSPGFIVTDLTVSEYRRLGFRVCGLGAARASSSRTHNSQ
jgi:NAD(P)-dependent dehydrogenase (short-subunit alcohol dehydrogenase family)